MFRVFALAASVLALGLASAFSTASAAEAPALGQVLILGDSVATGMLWHPDAVTIVQRNLGVYWQVAVCRRLTGESCWSEGVQPPTAVDVINSLPSVPPYVVMVMGYNDDADTFATSIDATMQALLAKGAQHVLWLTLRESEGPFPLINDQLWSALARWPQLELVDWNDYSANHPEWFQTDGVHLLPAGGVAMAKLIHGSLLELIEPLQVTLPTLPAMRLGRNYRVQLRAMGGTEPYRWRVAAGRPPLGLHLTASGQLFGTPRGRQAMNFVASVTDADGLTTTGSVRAATS
jgi:hypothetical protein